jgi:hypothetical protein
VEILPALLAQFDAIIGGRGLDIGEGKLPIRVRDAIDLAKASAS